MNRSVMGLALACAALAMGGGPVGAICRPDYKDKEPPSPEEMAKEREARKAEDAERERAYLERMEQRRLVEAARHPATQSKPQSDSLKRLLRKRRRRP